MMFSTFIDGVVDWPFVLLALMIVWCFWRWTTYLTRWKAADSKYNCCACLAICVSYVDCVFLWRCGFQLLSGEGR